MKNLMKNFVLTCLIISIIYNFILVSDTKPDLENNFDNSEESYYEQDTRELMSIFDENFSYEFRKHFGDSNNVISIFEIEDSIKSKLFKPLKGKVLGAFATISEKENTKTISLNDIPKSRYSLDKIKNSFSVKSSLDGILSFQEDWLVDVYGDNKYYKNSTLVTILWRKDDTTIFFEFILPADATPSGTRKIGGRANWLI
ncbi:MAG: hypothetical protein AAF573_10310 [Bacteroidota bacterium]